MPVFTRRWAISVLTVVLGLLVLASTALAAPRQVPYSEFLGDVQRGLVAEVLIADQSLQAVYVDGSVGLVNLPESSGNLPAMLIQYGAKVDFAESRGAGLGSLLIRLLPPFVILAGILWISRREVGGSTRGVLSMEQSPARLYRPGADPVTLRDVAGLDEVKEELQEVVDFLRNGSRYRALGARIPRGILLSGPPGTGKTLLARAVAGEAGVPFLSVSGSDFVEMYAGVGAARVRALFEKARQYAPCIVFVDEIDAVARQRGVSVGGGAEERDQTINQLLVEMDGFTPTEGIIVMAATNRIDILDAAILRPGRFDRQILVDPPDRVGRQEILGIHARNKPLAPDVSLERVATITPGFTGADLANLLNEAALLAARQQKRQITMAEITQAYERVVTGGPARQRVIAAPGRLRIAYHEAGHALVGRLLEGPEYVVKISIIPRGRALGYVMHSPGEDRNMYSRTELMGRLSALLAGRVAEELSFGEGSSGAADDLERVTAMARAMVTEWGMHPAFGPVRAAPSTGADPVGEQTRRAVDEAVKALVAEAYAKAVALLTEHREALDRVAGALLAQETLDGPDLERLLWPDLERDAAPVAADVAPDEEGSGRAWPVTGD